jgi:hypothetical protein
LDVCGGDPVSRPHLSGESLLAAIEGAWHSMFGTAGASEHANFYELGGDSLGAARLAHLIEEAAGRTVSAGTVLAQPTIPELARCIERLPPSRSVPSGPSETTVPLAPSQEWLWRLEQLIPRNTFFNSLVAIDVRGHFDHRSVEHALYHIVDRHAVLRTRYRNDAGTAVGVVSPDVEFGMRDVDLDGAGGGDVPATIRDLMRRHAAVPLDIQAGRTLNVLLARLSAGHHLVVCAFHHIVFDGASTQVFLREFLELYTSVQTARAPVLPGLSIQYADHAAEERRRMQPPALSGYLQRWERTLAALDSFEDPLAGIKRPRQVDTYLARMHPVRLGRDFTARLKAAAAHQQLTLFMLLAAGFAGTLGRLSRCDEVMIATLAANRSGRHTERMIGCFSNVVVLRVPVARGDTAIVGDELIAATREAAIEAYAHESLPLEVVLNELQVPEAARKRLFQVGLALHPALSAPTRIEETTLKHLSPQVDEGDGSLNPSTFDFTLELRESEEGLIGNVQYLADLYEESSIEMLVDRLKGYLTELMVA